MKPQTKFDRLQKLMRRRWVSGAVAFKECGLLSLSQRAGQLRRMGVKVIDRWAVSPAGARFKEYRIAA
jgi:hypothetical protein